MARLNSHTGILSALAALLILGGCFTMEEDAAVKPPPRDTTKVQLPDTTKRPIDTSIKVIPVDTGKTVVIGPKKNNGWDDFPNKYLPDLKILSAKMTKLPTPYGLRYNSQNNPRSKISADTACPEGAKEIFGMDIPERGFYVVDTIRYHSLTGEVGCRWFNLNMAKVTHNRYILDLQSGQAWEEVTDSIADEVVLPRHSITGHGRIRLNSTLEFNVRKYRVDMITPYSESKAIVTGGQLHLDWKDGYAFEMDIVKAMPFKVDDLFPIRGEIITEKVMSGPILHPGEAGKTDTLGYIDLHSDHSVVIRDWTGKAVEP